VIVERKSRMPARPCPDPYRRHYVDLEFERAGLFECIRMRFGPVTVLYPGSSIHITPSLFFPHVVYVDRSVLARAFFGRRREVQAYVDSNRTYRRRACVEFIAADYARTLPLRPGSFDLLLSLYGGPVVGACLRYVRPGGLIVSNRHGDGLDSAAAGQLELAAVIRFRGGRYLVDDDAPALPGSSEGRSAGDSGAGRAQMWSSRPVAGRDLRRSTRGLVYHEREIYAVYRKSGRTGRSRASMSSVGSSLERPAMPPSGAREGS
jgi:hypothetical protein